MTRPITPQEAGLSAATIPEFVIRAFNFEIERVFNGKTAKVDQETIMQTILNLGIEHSCQVSRSNVFARNWLDVEPLYRAAGWQVEYNMPNVREAAHFIFTPK